MDVFAGDIVYSKAGRDKEKPFVVLEVLSTEFVLIADGRLRRVEKPKKKKMKHLLKSGHASGYLQTKIAEGERVTNPDVKKVLAEFLEEHDA